MTWHLCACGCGVTVIVDLHPEGWKMLFDGVYVTLRPSIGNVQQDCRSHYLITHNEITWYADFM